jgi:soluble lytic murein transglycosylase-like protein
VTQALNDAARRHQLAPALLHTVARIESGGRPEAVSPKGATGVMQLMPATARQYGVRDIRDVSENIEGAARFLRHLMTKYGGSIPLVLAAYNAGERAVDRAGGRVPNIAETRAYVRRGMDLLRGQAA